MTLLAYVDLECPFSARVQAALNVLKKRYGPGKLRLVFRHNPLPFHERAREAAQFAQAVRDVAGSDAAFEFMATSFAHQDTLGPDTFRRWLTELGLDAAAVAERAHSREAGLAVDRDITSGRRLGVRGTPTAFLNGNLRVRPLHPGCRHRRAGRARPSGPDPLGLA